MGHSSELSRQVVAVGKLAVHLDNQEVAIGGARVHLTNKDYQIVELLAQRLMQHSIKICCSITYMAA